MSEKPRSAKPWVVYCRVSTEEQALEGVSLEVQRSACIALAKAYGYPISEVVEDPGFSGKDFDRPGIRRVLEMIQRREVAGVVIWKLDRLVRNLRQLLEFVHSIITADIQLVSVSEKIDTAGAIGRLFLQLLGALAEFERAQISERVKAAITHLKANGRFHGGPVPTGLDVILIDGKKFLGPHATYGPLVAEAFRQVIEGAPLSRIAGFFNENKVPNRSGRPWSINAVSGVLNQKRVIGHLIDQETFDRARAALASRANPNSRRNAKMKAKEPQRPSDRIWRLHGLAICAKCGSAMVGSASTGRGGILHYYLRCSGRMRRGLKFCDAADIPAEPWENAVVHRLIEYVSTGAITTELTKVMTQRQAGTSTARGKRDGLIRERDGVRQRLDRALELCLDGGAVARAYAAKIAELQERLERLSVEIAELDGQIAAADITESTIQITADLIKLAIQYLPNLPWDLQKQHLGKIIRQVRLGAGQTCSIDMRLPEPVKVDLAIRGQKPLVRTDGEQWLRTLDSVRTAEVVSIPLSVHEYRSGRGKREVALKPTTEEKPTP